MESGANNHTVCSAGLTDAPGPSFVTELAVRRRPLWVTRLPPQEARMGSGLLSSSTTACATRTGKLGRAVTNSQSSGQQCERSRLSMSGPARTSLR
jgi:hypothetical protein